jgi:hypothetical protein
MVKNSQKHLNLCFDGLHSSVPIAKNMETEIYLHEIEGAFYDFLGDKADFS